MYRTDRVYRKKLDFVFGATDQVIDIPIAIEGEIGQIHVKLPNFTTAVTAVAAILDEDSLKVYESAALAETAEHVLTVTRLIANKQTVRLTLNAAAGGAHTASIVLYWKGMG